MNKKELGNDKPPLSLIPSEIMGELAQVFEYGAKRHGRNNWRITGSVSTYVDAALRHIHAAHAGVGCDMDLDSGLHHYTHAIANLMIARLYLDALGHREEIQDVVPFFDDRFIAEDNSEEANSNT